MQQSSVQNRMPLLIAHRGESFDAPENTLASFALAWHAATMRSSLTCISPLTIN